MTSMTSLKVTGLLTGAMALAVVSPALSHHSHAMFDHSKEIAVTGTVTEFAFRNPHVLLYLEIKGENGEPADVVNAKVHPLKDGRPGGNYVTIVAADGKTYD